ncbi:MAG: S41 family peptidase [Pseudomonadota bacterium]
MKFTLLASAAALLSVGADAQTWHRQAAISPNGAQIAFAHDGDVWVVSSAGGLARPLTTHEAYDGHPVWSRDGREIAFASDRYGDFDIFVMPSSGGPATRLTHHSADDIPSDMLSNGEVVFESSRLDDPANAQFPSGVLPELYVAGRTGGLPRHALTTPAIGARFSADETQMLYYDRKGYEDIWRKRHTSSIARDVWLYDPSSGAHTKLTDFAGEDREPVFDPAGGGYYYLSEQGGTFNVWRGALDGAAAPEQVTFFDTHPVRDLSISDDGALAFTHHGAIYRLPAGGEPVRVIAETMADGQSRSETPLSVSGGATEMTLSPNGEEIAFVHRGEIFVTAVDFSTTKQITDTPEQERSVSFSPDGRALVYAGERDGSWNLYETRLVDEAETHFYRATSLSETTLLATEEETFQPLYSPDGEEIAYLSDRNELRVLTKSNGRTREVLAAEQNYSYSDGDISFDWSPDGNWLSASFYARSRWRPNIAIIAADGESAPFDASLSGYTQFAPRWAMGGQALLWVGDRYGERSHGSWGSETDVFAAFMTQEAYDRFNLSKEDFQALEAAEKPEEDAENGEDKADEDDTVEPVDIEWERLRQRTDRLTIHSSDLAAYALASDGAKLYYLARFEKGYDLWVRDFREEETKLLVKLGAEDRLPLGLALSEDDKTAFVLADGRVQKVNLEDGKATPVDLSGAMTVRGDEERAYMFEHIWRQVREKFYLADLHGVDWDGLKAEYARILPGIGNNRDFTIAMSEMLGELNASHTGARYRPTRPDADATAALGAFFDLDFDGPGVRIAEVMAGGPLSRADVAVPAGAVITAIDGRPLAAGDNIYALLNHKAGQLIRLTVRDTRRGDPRDVKVRPISRGEEAQLRYERWVRERRDIVEEASGGRLGYVHVRGMNDESFREAFSETFGRNLEKEGLVVDTRFNGGGWLHDDLVVMLSGRRYMDFVPRGQELRGEPEERWQKPSVVVVSESNYSDAHMFPYAYRALGVGEIVGMPVPGTGTAVWWERLHTDDIIFGIPQVGMRGVEGRFLENLQLEPDHLVNLDPVSAAEGRDTQLLKAVEVLLADLDAG